MACQTPVRQSTAESIRFSPQSFGRDLTLNQQLQVRQAGQNHKVEVLLEINATHIRLAGFSAGHKVMSLVYDGQKLISDQSPFFPKAVSAASILENIALTFWPLPILQQQLPRGWSVIETPQQRDIYRDGVLYLSISYDTPQRWEGTVQITNPLYPYHLTIHSHEIAHG
jgi:hypothetical protein